MSGWDSWAANVVAAAAPNGATGAAVYDPCSGAIWGKSGEFDCAGNLNQYDSKAEGKDASAEPVNGEKFMFIRKTQDDEPCSVFKKGANSLFTTKGPSGSRVAVFVKEQKPESAVNAAASYLKPHQ